MRAPVSLGPRPRSVIPGFGVTMGLTLLWLSLIVLLPLAGLFLRPPICPSTGSSRSSAAAAPCMLSSCHSGCRLLAAAVNLVFGADRRLGAGALRVSRPALLDALVDLPFALPTAVAGIALTALYAPNGLDRRLAGAARDQGRLHAARHLRRAGVHRPALRGAHRAAGAARISTARSRRRPRRSAPAARRPLCAA